MYVESIKNILKIIIKTIALSKRLLLKTISFITDKTSLINKPFNHTHQYIF